MVDYSKWDKMANDMSDSDEEVDGSIPQVTTFDEPQSVTFGGTAKSQKADGWGEAATAAAPAAATGQGDGATVAPTTNERVGTRPTAPVAPPSGETSQQKRRAPITDADLAENGAEIFSHSKDDGAHSNPGSAAAEHGRLRYVWRQSRNEVVVVIPAPAGTRAADVRIDMRAKQDTVAIGVAELIRVTVESKLNIAGEGISAGATVGNNEYRVGAGSGGGGCGLEMSTNTTEYRPASSPSTTTSRNMEKNEDLLVLLDGELRFQAALEEGGVDWELKDFPGTRVSNCHHWPGPSVAANGSSGARELLEVGATGEPPEAVVKAERQGEKSDDVLLTTGVSGGIGGARGGIEAGSRTNGGTSSSSSRGIEITLKKHCPIPNAVVWWKSLLKGEPEIDVSAIKGRSNSSNHQSAWAEAMSMFKTKMADRKNREKIAVDTGEH